MLFNSVFLRLANPYAPFIVLVALDALAFLLLAFDLALFFVFALLLDFGDAFLGAIFAFAATTLETGASILTGSVAKFLLAARATPVQISPTRVSACEAPP